METIKQILVRYVSQLFLIVTLAGLGWFAYRTYVRMNDAEQKYHDLIGKEDEFKRLSDYAASLERRYADEKALREKLEKEWAEEKSALEGRIKILASSTFSGKSKQSELRGADYVDPNGKWSMFEARFLRGTQAGPPACWFQVYKDGQGVTKVYDHRIQVNMAVSRRDDDGRYTILTKAAYILSEADIDERYKGKSGWRETAYPLEVTGGTATIDPTEQKDDPRFYWWAPHLNAGINFGVESGGFFSRPTIGASFLGYGASKNDLKWKFLNAGIGFDTKFSQFDLNLMPFLYRPFDAFITNTYVGPGISISSRGTGYFLGLSLGF